MMKSLRHMGRLIKVGFILSRHDALMDLLSLFGEPPRAVEQIRRLRRNKTKTKDTDHRPLVEAFQSLGPSFIKIGQAMATRPDIVGIDVARDLMRLQDKVPPFPGAEAIAIIEQELEAPLNELFKDFNPEPVAAASIAQVHFATTIEGKAVAVKVLRPGIAKAFARDLESFLWLARKAEAFSVKARRLKPGAVVETIAQTIALEMDLRFEAASASELRENCAHNPDYNIPEIDWSRTGRQILTIERVEGIAFSHKQAITKAGLDTALLADHLIHSFLSQALNDGFFHADLHQGNLFACADNKITAIDFGIMGRIDKNTRKCLAEILYGFLQRDYDLVARAHFRIGYVPEDQSLEKFKQAIRTIGDPIIDKPVKEISVGKLLAQLFEITEMFNMQTQPQLILLQKTMVTVEGVALDLNPDINMWESSRPIIEKWMLENLGPQAKIRDFAETGLETLTRLPKIMDDVALLAKSARDLQNLRASGPKGKIKSLFYGFVTGLIAAFVITILYNQFN